MKIDNTGDIRQFLIVQMVKTAEGKLDAAQAKTLCNFAQQIYNTVKLEMSFAKLKTSGEITKIEPVSWNGKNDVPQRSRLRSVA